MWGSGWTHWVSSFLKQMWSRDILYWRVHHILCSSEQTHTKKLESNIIQWKLHRSICSAWQKHQSTYWQSCLSQQTANRCGKLHSKYCSYLPYQEWQRRNELSNYKQFSRCCRIKIVQSLWRILWYTQQA